MLGFHSIRLTRKRTVVCMWGGMIDSLLTLIELEGGGILWWSLHCCTFLSKTTKNTSIGFMKQGIDFIQNNHHQRQGWPWCFLRIWCLSRGWSKAHKNLTWKLQQAYTILLNRVCLIRYKWYVHHRHCILWPVYSSTHLEKWKSCWVPLEIP